MRPFRHARGLLLYVLIYWGRTVFGLLIAASTVVWLVDGNASGLRTALAAAALAVASFSLGLAVGEIGSLPPGKRR